MLTFGLIARAESDAWIAAAFGIIPLSVGIGFFVDSMLIRRDCTHDKNGFVIPRSVIPESFVIRECCHPERSEGSRFSRTRAETQIPSRIRSSND